jgi:hypothetical protein
VSDFRDIPFAFAYVKFYNDPAQGLAYCNRRTGGLYINKAHWYKLPEEQKFWVLSHEEGHVVEQTRDEIEADAHAHRKYMAAGLPLSQSVKALTTHLQEGNQVHIARAWLQLQRTLQHDFNYNHHDAAYRPRYDNTANVKHQLQTMHRVAPHPAMVNPHDHDNESHFLGFGKKAKARKTEKRAFRSEKRQIRLERKRSKIGNRNSKAESRLILAEQGISQPSDFSQGLSAVTSLASSIMGGGGQGAPVGNERPQPTMGDMQQAAGAIMGAGGNQQQPFTQDEEPEYEAPAPRKEDPKKKDSKTWLIVAGVAVVVIVVVVIMFKKK